MTIKQYPAEIELIGDKIHYWAEYHFVDLAKGEIRPAEYDCDAYEFAAKLFEHFQALYQGRTQSSSPILRDQPFDK